MSTLNGTCLNLSAQMCCAQLGYLHISILQHML